MFFVGQSVMVHLRDKDVSEAHVLAVVNKYLQKRGFAPLMELSWDGLVKLGCEDVLKLYYITLKSTGESVLNNMLGKLGIQFEEFAGAAYVTGSLYDWYMQRDLSPRCLGEVLPTLFVKRAPLWGRAGEDIDYKLVSAVDLGLLRSNLRVEHVIVTLEVVTSLGVVHELELLAMTRNIILFKGIVVPEQAGKLGGLRILASEAIENRVRGAWRFEFQSIVNGYEHWYLMRTGTGGATKCLVPGDKDWLYFRTMQNLEDAFQLAQEKGNVILDFLMQLPCLVQEVTLVSSAGAWSSFLNSCETLELSEQCWSLIAAFREALKEQGVLQQKDDGLLYVI